MALLSNNKGYSDTKLYPMTSKFSKIKGIINNFSPFNCDFKNNSLVSSSSLMNINSEQALLKNLLFRTPLTKSDLIV